MSDPKLAKAVQSLFRQVFKLARKLTKGLVTWLLRVALVSNRRRGRYSIAGFVLPTTTLLILVVALTAGALSYRAFNTSSRAIGEVENRVIYNAGTPAIDRAKAKLEFLFDANQDTRFPGGVPSEEILTSMMINNANGTVPPPIRSKGAPYALLVDGKDVYTLPNEQRVDINGDSKKDNAWAFRADTDENGSPDATVVYSILFSTPSGNGTLSGSQRLIQMSDREKIDGESDTASAMKLSYARSGPLTSAKANSCSNRPGGAAAGVEGGWYEDTNNTAVLRKNFQIDVMVIPDAVAQGKAGSNFTTLEVQQDRRLDRGNKWGAWFRNDLEIFPGPQFNWNGAMHTEGSLLLGGSSFTAYLISSKDSCLYYKSASEISVAKTKDADTNRDFFGLVASGTVKNNSYASGADRSSIHLFPGSGKNPTDNTALFIKELNPGNDAVAAGQQGTATPSRILSDAREIQIRNGYQSRNSGDLSNASARQAGIDQTFDGRFRETSEPAPYVDDTYRADNRYGPKQKYKDGIQIPNGTNPPGVGVKSVGQIIGSDDPNADKLLALSPNAGEDSSAVGLDGYWERRARNEGLRILVGARLELGNSFGWEPPKDRPATAQALDQQVVAGDGDLVDLRNPLYGDVTTAAQVSGTRNNLTSTPNMLTSADPDTSDEEGDPLYRPHGYGAAKTMRHEQRQRRSLRDNLAAVQSTAVYHYAVDRDFPVACLATTAHPGSPFSLQESINFVPDVFRDRGSTTDTVLMTDFFLGHGTNGWEFEPPAQSNAAFASAVANANSPLRIALDNLAQFAGDHISDASTGAFPPTQKAGEIHPDPEFAMWGNFSNLRRTLAQLRAGATYDTLSPADKTYLQTAACTIGMLAYNVNQIQRFDPTNPNNDIVRPGFGQSVVESLGNAIYRLMDGVDDPTGGNYEVIPRQRLATYKYNSSETTPDFGLYNPRDYDGVPAEAFLGKLRESILGEGGRPNDPRIRLAEVIFEHYQIRRDRTYGFRPSPAANTWNFNPYVANIRSKATTWSSACDPNDFALRTTMGQATGRAGALLNYPNNDDRLDRTRLGLSRLCGTIIQAGAVHDGPGDLHYPARNDKTVPPANTTPSLTSFGESVQIGARWLLRENNAGNPIRMPFSNPVTYAPLRETLALVNPSTGTAWTTSLSPDGTMPTPVEDDALQRQFRQIQAFFDSTINSGTYNGVALNGGRYGQLEYRRAQVQPKWPSLYYLFPMVEHDHDGAITTLTIGGVNVCLDHRQPNGLLLPVNYISCQEEGSNPMVAAFQPWAEPYITDTYVKLNNPVGTVRYRPVDGDPNPTVAPLAYYEVRYGFDDPGQDNPVVASRPAAGSFDNTLPSGVAADNLFTYLTFPFPLQSSSVGAVAISPRKLPSGTGGLVNPSPLEDEARSVWRLPIEAHIADYDTAGGSGSAPQYKPTNRIRVPNGNNDTGRTAVTMLLDRVLFNGREQMPARVLDIDVGMMRRYSPAAKEAWLPAVSGIIYAFREDSVREDAINRAPSAATSTDPANSPVSTNATVPGEGTEVDPPLLAQNLSVKAVDFVPDPERRVHGFRLRDASQLKRLRGDIPADENIRGISLFTDDPVYIMGFYNLHQKGAEDQGNYTDEAPGGAYETDFRLEEFRSKLPTDRLYNDGDFYGNRTTLDTNFANPTSDRWRPSEILADAITILSDTFCDGSVLDTFMTAGNPNSARITTTTYTGRSRFESGAAALRDTLMPYTPRTWTSSTARGAAIYNDTNTGLFGRGCADNGITSFLNQNRPRYTVNSNPAYLTTSGGGTADLDLWSWVRENPADIYGPVRISRNGSPMLTPPNNSTEVVEVASRPELANYARKPEMVLDYDRYTLQELGRSFPQAYYTLAEDSNNQQRPVMGAQNTRVNSIIVSGLVPSRINQSYGGMHNFPRFLETWSRLWFAGSFLQLNFSNYATSPFDQDAFEPGATPAGDERISYYGPPNRLWGYDVALQLAPAGPAAARFVTATREANEFYSEPAASDPYMNALCNSLKLGSNTGVVSALGIGSTNNLRCPS